MITYEYLTAEIPQDNLDPTLDAWGADGWELLTAHLLQDGDFFYFHLIAKRPKPDNPLAQTWNAIRDRKAAHMITKPLEQS